MTSSYYHYTSQHTNKHVTITAKTHRAHLTLHLPRQITIRASRCISNLATPIITDALIIVPRRGCHTTLLLLTACWTILDVWRTLHPRDGGSRRYRGGGPIVTFVGWAGGVGGVTSWRFASVDGCAEEDYR